MPESLVEKLSVRKCITVNENDNLKVIFHNKVQGIAPGQSAAFYEDNDLVAGGFIMKT